MAAVVQLGKLAAFDAAFAWHGHGGEVVTWGIPEWGGDNSQVITREAQKRSARPSNWRCFCCHR